MNKPNHTANGQAVPRARHVVHSATAARIGRLRSLVLALQMGPLTRDDIGAILQLGPSGVRKYLAELQGKVVVADEGGMQVCRLALRADEVQAYLVDLAAGSLARPSVPTTRERAGREPSRRVHVLRGNERVAMRAGLDPVDRDPLVAALFGARPMAVPV